MNCNLADRPPRLTQQLDQLMQAGHGRVTDLWIMGGDQHCFGQYRSVVMPKMANWLVKKLAARKSARQVLLLATGGHPAARAQVGYRNCFFDLQPPFPIHLKRVH